MKHTVLTGALCLVLGIAIGWIAKPRSSESPALAGDAPEPRLDAPATLPANATRNPESSGLASKSVRPAEDAKEQNPAFTMGVPNPEMQERLQKMMLDQAKQKIDRRVAEIARNLGLTEAQTARLQASFDDQFASITSQPGNNGFPDMLALTKLQSNQSIDTALAGILTDEQSTAYEDLKTKERNRKVESRAYKDLARINSALDLDDDQKNAVYDIVYEDATRKIDESDASGSAMAMIMDGHGIDIDVDDIAIGGIGTVVEDNPGAASREDVMKSMRENRQRKIDEQVDRLAPALTPEQTEQYRKHLETKNAGMFQNMIFEEGDGATGVFSIETPGPE